MSVHNFLGDLNPRPNTITETSKETATSAVESLFDRNKTDFYKYTHDLEFGLNALKLPAKMMVTGFEDARELTQNFNMSKIHELEVRDMTKAQALKNILECMKILEDTIKKIK